MFTTIKMQVYRDYYSLEIAPLDLQYLDDLWKAYGIDWREITFEIPNEGCICNAILYELLYAIARKEVSNDDDLDKITWRIYCNCIDSGYDISSDDVETQEAKDFLDNF